jgi:uncharacterized protein YdaU (DUF1376 family)
VKELPYFRWYPSDAQSDINYTGMTLEELGLFHLALNFSWMNDGLPDDDSQIARSLHLTVREARTVWSAIKERFPVWPDGRRRNNRQEGEREYAERKSSQATSAVRSRKDRKTFVHTDVDRSYNGRTTDDLPRAYGSVSDSGFVSEKRKETFLADESKFEEFWAIWSAVRGTHHRAAAFQAWISVAAGLEADAIECARSYLSSLDNHAKGFNPENFLFDAARDNFSGRWPAFAVKNGKGKSAHQLKMDKLDEELERYANS